MVASTIANGVFMSASTNAQTIGAWEMCSVMGLGAGGITTRHFVANYHIRKSERFNGWWTQASRLCPLMAKADLRRVRANVCL
jgi:hypothetical protein